MKRKIIMALLAALTSVCAYAQFSVGMRDNRFVYADYTLLNHYVVKVEQSLFSEKIAYQYARIYVGYKRSWKMLDYGAYAYFGSAYNGSYRSTGAMIMARGSFFSRIMIEGKLNPHYDSGFGYKTCFYVGAGISITRDIDVRAGYTTVPEYRMSEKRVRMGLGFHAAGLTVEPAVSVATSGASKAKSLRVLMNFNYRF